MSLHDFVSERKFAALASPLALAAVCIFTGQEWWMVPYITAVCIIVFLLGWCVARS